MTQVESKDIIKYNKHKKYYYWSSKILRTHKDKQKPEDKKGIISMFATETKINVDTVLEIHGECIITSTFKEGEY